MSGDDQKSKFAINKNAFEQFIASVVERNEQAECENLCDDECVDLRNCISVRDHHGDDIDDLLRSDKECLELGVRLSGRPIVEEVLVPVCGF